MGYINKYKGFIIPEKGIVSSSDPSTSFIVLENPTLKANINLGVTVEDYVTYSEEEYNNFVKQSKESIDSFMDDYDKKEEEKRNRRYNR